MSVLDFMGSHPILTVILALIITDATVKSVAAARGYYDRCHCADTLKKE